MTDDAELEDHARDLRAKLQWLLDFGNHWSEDGYFCFPDGEIWRKEEPNVEEVGALERPPCLICDHPDHSAVNCEATCEQCGDPIDYCIGHGELG